jgi:hypothetical protein
MPRRGPVLVGQVVGRRGVHSVRQVAVLLRMMVEPRLRRAFARSWRAGVARYHRAITFTGPFPEAIYMAPTPLGWFTPPSHHARPIR